MGNMDYLPPNSRINGGNIPPVFKKRSESFKWFIIGFAGIIIIFIGSIWVTYASWAPPPKYTDYPNNHEYTKALNDWKNATEYGNLYGRIIIDVGAFVMIIGGFLGYIDPAVDDPNKKILLGMLTVAMFILIIVSVGIVVQSPYMSSLLI